MIISGLNYVGRSWTHSINASGKYFVFGFNAWRLRWHTPIQLLAR